MHQHLAKKTFFPTYLVLSFKCFNAFYQKPIARTPLLKLVLRLPRMSTKQPTIVVVSRSNRRTLLSRLPPPLAKRVPSGVPSRKFQSMGAPFNKSFRRSEKVPPYKQSNWLECNERNFEAGDGRPPIVVNQCRCLDDIPGKVRTNSSTGSSSRLLVMGF